MMMTTIKKKNLKTKVSSKSLNPENSFKISLKTGGNFNFRNSIIYVSLVFYSLYSLIGDDVYHSPSPIGNS